ncbi:MAG: hypothetical protein WD115_00840 [Balneolaceae bacterium]
MKHLLMIITLTVILSRSLMAQVPEEDPVGQWIFQIEQQILQNPASSDRLIRRIGSLRDPDLLNRLQRRWKEIQIGPFSSDQRLALFDIEAWIAFQTGSFDGLTETLRKNGLGDNRPDRWLELAERLDQAGAYEQARIAWKEMEGSSLTVYRCRALEGRARSHLQEGVERLKTASPLPPSPNDSFLQSRLFVQSLLRESTCRQHPDLYLGTLLKLVGYLPSAIHILEDLETSVPLTDPVRDTPEWTTGLYHQAVNQHEWSEARYLVGLLLADTRDEPLDGRAEWRLAHLELADGESDMANLQLNAMRQMPDAEYVNDLTMDLFLWRQLSDHDPSWYSAFILFPSTSPDSLAEQLHSLLPELEPRTAGTLLYRLHQRAGHQFGTWFSDMVQEIMETMNSTDPLVPYLHWTLLQQMAWALTDMPESGSFMSDFRNELQGFLDTYPSHPVHEMASNQ